VAPVFKKACQHQLSRVPAAQQAAAAAYVWWNSYCSTRLPGLQPVAVKIVSKLTSASACERDWSSVEFIIGKRRCSLGSSRLGKLVRTRQNLQTQKRKADADDKGDMLTSFTVKHVCEEHMHDSLLVSVEQGEELLDADDMDAVLEFLANDEE
jgi:hypothetical protein